MAEQTTQQARRERMARAIHDSEAGSIVPDGSDRWVRAAEAALRELDREANPALGDEGELREALAEALRPHSYNDLVDSDNGDVVEAVMTVVCPLLAAKDEELRDHAEQYAAQRGELIVARERFHAAIEERDRLRCQRDEFLDHLGDDVRRYHAADNKDRAEVGRLIGAEDAMNQACAVFEIKPSEVRHG